MHILIFMWLCMLEILWKLKYTRASRLALMVWALAQLCKEQIVYALLGTRLSFHRESMALIKLSHSYAVSGTCARALLK